MKKIILLVFIGLINLTSYSQKKLSSKLGDVSKKELEMVTYEPDTIAGALILKEHGNHYLDKKRNYRKTTDFYFKVKILKKKGFDKSVVKIRYYDEEKIHHIKGITYNLLESGKVQKKHLLEKDIYYKDLGNKWKEAVFTMPDIKEGSVIEYVYSLTSPYSSIDDWKFQSDIPKMKSDFTASILGNWQYNVRIIGFLKLNRNDQKIQKDCIDIPGLSSGACVNLSYGMDSIPAFEEEDYMLSPDNYKAKLSFELAVYKSPRGEVKKYTSTWKDADKALKNNFLDKQASKKGYFKRKLPEHFFTVASDLEKAKLTFQFIQNHFNWNGKYWPSRNVKVKKAFDQGTGNIFDINLSLYNSLQALNIQSYLVLSKTRNRAVPIKVHPVINEFNYLFVKVILDGKIYYLDATDKFLPFGLVRFEAINGDGRVLDFDKGSFWEEIAMKTAARESVKVKLNVSEVETTGTMKIIKTGYKALNRRKKLASKTKEEIIEAFESDHPYFEIEDCTIEKKDVFAEPLTENYEFVLETDLQNDKQIISPFLISKIGENPFKLNKRDYPVDFGYPKGFTYILSIKLPEGHTVKELLKSRIISLPNKGGRLIINNHVKDGEYLLFFKFNINKSIYSNVEYFDLKEFFKEIIKIQEETIEIVKE